MNKLVLGVMLLLGANAFAVTQSAYTSVEVADCVTLNSSEFYGEDEGDFYKGECPSLGGYQAYVAGGDIRYSLELSYDGVEIPLVRLGAFHDMGSPKIEWRYERTTKGFNSAVEYTALIYRLRYQNYSDEKDFYNTDMLVVVKLNGKKSCVVAKLENVKDMNEKARVIADDKNAKCLDLGH